MAEQKLEKLLENHLVVNGFNLFVFYSSFTTSDEEQMAKFR